MRGKKNANVKSAGATSSSTSTRKPSAKRARSPEPIIPGGSDAAQPKNKRSKQAASGGSTATTQLVATGATAIVQVNDSQPPPPTFAGNFDLYDMELPFLSKVYLPEGVSIPQYEDLYKTILTYQAKDDKTARIFLASPTDQKSVTSKFICSSIEDPMEDFPFDIKIHSIEHNASLSLPSDKLPSGASASAAPDKSGVSASMSLEDDHCGIQSASGAFKLKRVWTKATAGGAFTELFAGYLTFNVSYSGMYKRKGHGAGQKHKWGFWAVRAKTGNDGMEVGLQPMLPVAVRASANPPTHPVAATVASAAPATSKQAASQGTVSAAPKFAGTYNLYSLCGLLEEIQSPGEPFPSPEDVYNAITSNNHEIHAKCRFSSSYDSGGSYLGFGHSEGRFRDPTINDPHAEQPYDIIVASTEEEESLSFTEEELDQFPVREGDPSGPGMTAQITLSEREHPGVIEGSGHLKFVRVWAKAGGNGELLEVFEVFINLDVRFELSFTLYGQRFRPSPPRETHAVAYWAVRAGKDDGSGGDWFADESSGCHSY